MLYGPANEPSPHRNARDGTGASNNPQSGATSTKPRGPQNVDRGHGPRREHRRRPGLPRWTDTRTDGVQHRTGVRRRPRVLVATNWTQT
jgi:hypothetical protein